MRTFWIIILAGAALAVFAYWNRKADSKTSTAADKTDKELAAEIFKRMGQEAGKIPLTPTGVPVPPQVTLSVI